ncbi:protein of unknown function DUF4371 - like 1 [Theobroma cacao]|nr:protein of unknown function DUF4371 - like 1 [Theobroma cacao]
MKAYEDLMKQKQHIDIMVVGISSQAKLDDRVGLNASIECVRVSLKNAPENHKLNAPSIQKDICNTAAFLTTRAMIEDIGDDFFSLLVDEARDSAILEVAVDSLFATHGLSMSHIHGQGYNGANNMSGNVNSLKIARKHEKLCSFFDYLATLINFVGASRRRKEILQMKQIEKIVERIARGNMATGRGLNQEATLKRLWRNMLGFTLWYNS